MNTPTQKRNGNDRSSTMRNFSDTGVAAARFQNFTEVLADEIRAGVTPVTPESMAETDAVFAIDTILKFMKHRAVNSLTPEKKRHQRRLYSKAQFLQTLEKDGGVYSSAEAADILGRSKPTVKTWKDTGRLLALDIDGEFYYPVFQFTDEEGISDKGVLRGVAELLPMLSSFSDRMKYSFFMEERNTVLDGLTPAGRTFTIAEVLKGNPDAKVMDELRRLARNYGTQNAV
ncbi:hypothetical protein GQM22_19015 [Escherichia coli]|uniref:helix-turn-helix domain-containing protein n=1 Tax=Escherichia coli TaxID=562 RepID=UPI0013029317|nr:helix-turn-helix domain-containing protein [Escherichia coli]EJZ3076446.1 helix-turn-helix domain-containing protein [Escherichia coli]KAE9824002.1 hypothetical protein GP646_19015 [Escherichia coli]MDS1689641.1 helix-turn-helix domain-containing protein [Escherichia coli]MWK17191.1 hypothetical protein [Escherichia coli]MWK85105.1 hypothetical protein [Escherichia coli]